MRKRGLRDNLTYGEFHALACRKPDLGGRWIYWYEAVSMDSDIEQPYPKFDVWVSANVLFLSLDDALAHMRQNIESRDESCQFYCHRITQLPVGQNDSEHGARWLYDAEGKLIDYAISSWTGEPENFHFFGRPKERTRFKKGDIVEVCDRTEVRLMLVVAPEPSVESCWEIYQRCKTHAATDERKFYYSQDPSDEQCVVVDGPGYEYHEHVSPLRMMKPRFPVPDELRREMLGWLDTL